MCVCVLGEKTRFGFVSDPQTSSLLAALPNNWQFRLAALGIPFQECLDQPPSPDESPPARRKGVMLEPSGSASLLASGRVRRWERWAQSQPGMLRGGLQKNQEPCWPESSMRFLKWLWRGNMSGTKAFLFSPCQHGNGVSGREKESSGKLQKIKWQCLH